jgi:FMN phosphatase YigB (HAD superfamily)
LWHLPSALGYFSEEIEMASTLLLDLDDTLLVNPLDQFIPAYLRLFATFVGDLIDPKQFGRQLLASTDQMVANNKITQTLKQTFDNDFFPTFMDKRNQLEPRIEEFYREQYPTLKKFTRPRKESIQLVESAFAHGMNVAVATNPIFPLQAQLQRLEWANLPLSQYPFKLVTAYEGLHFAKPNVAYYAEILANLGWPDEPVCMIGDTFSDDILPAQVLGISTYLVKNPERPTVEIPSEFSSGTLDNVENWLASNSGKISFASKESILAGLQASPAAVDSLLGKPSQSFTEIPLKNILQEWIKLENDFVDLCEEIPSFDQLKPIALSGTDLSAKEIFTIFIQHRATLIDNLQNVDFSMIKHLNDWLLQMIQNDQDITRRLIRLVKP